MKAVVLDIDGKLRLTEADEPEPGPGQVAVRVAYAGIQWGDVLVRDGRFPTERPFVPGFEASGYITEVGEGVDTSRVGEQVVALTQAGAYAETVLAPAVHTFDATGIAPRTAGGFGWATPAAYAIVNEVGRVRPGDHVLVQAAAGGVGSLAVQFAKLAGAASVTGVVRTAEQAAYAEAVGCDEVITADAFPDALGERRFDVVLDAIGGAVREKGIKLLAPHGRFVAYGNIATFDPVAVHDGELLAEGKSLLTYNSHLLSATHPDRLAEYARAAVRLVAAGRVRVDVTAEFELADVDDAIRRLAEGGSRGKTVLRVS